MELRVTQAGVFNVAAIATIGRKSFRNAFEHSFHTREELFDYLEYTYDPLKLLKSIQKPGNLYLLASYDDAPVAFAKIKKDSLNKHISVASQMELQKLYVLPGHQGAGIGTLLLNEVKAQARELNIEYIWLDTHVANHKAIRLYEKNGFQKIGKHFFTIGTQTFEYHVMSHHIQLNEANHEKREGTITNS